MNWQPILSKQFELRLYEKYHIYPSAFQFYYKISPRVYGFMARIDSNCNLVLKNFVMLNVHKIL